ncbi:hypothetical protein [Citricoccus muralis]|uniref:hypothetical protein n=1 Tax=Citricoccus muralis TaxID=169134 RepID=UPI000E249AAC|nr:hypothetical protein [Citricoccus muralis]
MTTPPPPHLLEHDAGRSRLSAGGTRTVRGSAGRPTAESALNSTDGWVDWSADGSTDADVAAAAASARRRTRLKLALAALPLVLAVTLLLVKAFGGPADSGGQGAPDGPHGSGGSGGSVGTEANHTGAAAVAAGDVAVAAVQEGQHRASPDGGPVFSGGAGESHGRPEVPAGHRAVAVRFASPDAVGLVAAGDRIDIVGTDGSVLEANVEVLQDRSTDLATVLVLAVAEGRAAELAAAAVNQDLTLLVTPEP